MSDTRDATASSLWANTPSGEECYTNSIYGTRVLIKVQCPCCNKKLTLSSFYNDKVKSNKLGRWTPRSQCKPCWDIWEGASPKTVENRTRDVNSLMDLGEVKLNFNDEVTNRNTENSRPNKRSRILPNQGTLDI